MNKAEYKEKRAIADIIIGIHSIPETFIEKFEIKNIDNSIKEITIKVKLYNGGEKS